MDKSDQGKKIANLITVEPKNANTVGVKEADTLLSGAQNYTKNANPEKTKWWKKHKDPQKEELRHVSYFGLFRFASAKDKLLIFTSIVAAILSGCILPFNTIVFAELLNAMVLYGVSLIMGQPVGAADAFLSEVKWFAIYNCIFGSIMLLGGYLATVCINMAAYNQIYRIRREYLKAAMNQDFAWYDMHDTGDFASKMADDLVKLEDGINEKLTNFIYYQVCFLSSMIMALIKGWKLALVCLTSFPVTLLLVGTAGVVAGRLGKKEAVAYGKAASVAEEVLGALRTVYAFSGQEKEVQRFQNNLGDARQIHNKKSVFTGLTMGIMFFLIFCTYALAFWYGVRLILDPEENYDASRMIVVFFGVLMGSMNFGISTSIMEALGMSKGAGAQIFHMIDNVPKINPLLDRGERPDKIEGNLEFSNVVFNYPSRPDVPILRGVSLSVKRGQTVALVGASGCGKSTIIQLISRFYDPDSGFVKLDGRSVSALSVRWLRSQIGLVGQEPVLFNCTVYENISYGAEAASRAQVEEAARKANAHQFIVKLPQGYNTLVGERGTALSGGQKQRIAIARALVRNPPILLLDEATSALDNTSEAKVQMALDKAREGRTTVVVAHRLSTIRNADVIYAFQDGRVVESGTHDELMKMQGLYHNMVKVQTLPEMRLPSGISRQESAQSASVEEIPEYIEKAEPDETEEAMKIGFMRVLRLASPERSLVAIASCCSLISGFSMPLLSVIFGDFVGVLSNPDESEVKSETDRYSLLFVGVGVLSGITNFLQVYLFGIAGGKLTERLRRQMFEHILRQEVAFFDDKRNSTGALCAKLSGEASYVQGATGQRIGTVLQAVGTLGLAMVLGLRYEYRVGLVSLAFVPAILAVLYKQGQMARAESYGTAKTMENSTKIAIDVVSNIRTVASLGREHKFLEEYTEQLGPGLRLAKKAAHLRGLIFGISRALFNFVYAAAMYYGGYLIVSDNVPYENVLKTAQALIMGTSSAANAFAFAPNFQRGLNAAGRIIVLLNRVPRVLSPEHPQATNFVSKGQAALEAVQFAYPTRPAYTVLKGIDLLVQPGKTVALVGHSGCGKSTVIQLLERYYDPTGGAVTMDDISIKSLMLPEVRKNIGLVQQEPVLFDRTIAENIAYGDNDREPSMDEIIDAAKQANIHNFVTSLPMGYDTRLGSKGAQLSGGQKQRVAIARALLRRPKILLLDEATSALDTESEKIVQEALDKAKVGRTCITIAHRLTTIHDADVICVFSDGVIAEQGSHDELIHRGGAYTALNRAGRH